MTLLEKLAQCIILPVLAITKTLQTVSLKINLFFAQFGGLDIKDQSVSELIFPEASWPPSCCVFTWLFLGVWPFLEFLCVHILASYTRRLDVGHPNRLILTSPLF